MSCACPMADGVAEIIAAVRCIVCRGQMFTISHGHAPDPADICSREELLAGPSSMCDAHGKAFLVAWGRAREAAKAEKKP